MNKYPQTSKTSTTTGGGARRLKTEGYCSDTLHAKRDRKRIEAEDRQREHAGLTTAEKMDLCCRRRGDSSREFKRLQQRATRERDTVATKA